MVLNNKYEDDNNKANNEGEINHHGSFGKQNNRKFDLRLYYRGLLKYVNSPI